MTVVYGFSGKYGTPPFRERKLNILFHSIYLEDKRLEIVSIRFGFVHQTKPQAGVEQFLEPQFDSPMGHFIAFYLCVTRG